MPYRHAKRRVRPPGRAPNVVVVGAGFAGFDALRRLERLVPSGRAVLRLIAPTDYLLYSPLLPAATAQHAQRRGRAVAHNVAAMPGGPAKVRVASNTVESQGAPIATASRPRSTARSASRTSTRRKELGMTTESWRVNQELAPRGHPGWALPPVPVGCRQRRRDQ